MKVVILCGGEGSRLREETEHRPKPMLEIGSKPILWHIMKTYEFFGYKDFVLCLGYKGEVIKRYFYEYELLSNDVTIELGKGTTQFHGSHPEEGWKVTMVDTGLKSLTGCRVKRVERYIDTDMFMLTYGDGVTDVNINDLVAFHKSHGKIGTLTGVTPPSRYGELLIEGDHVQAFLEKPSSVGGSINGGYFVFNKKFFDYLENDEGCILEREPLERLAKDGELKVFPHNGFWQCMDTYRDYRYLNELWESGRAYWRKQNVR